jgi:hypothetical protein
VNNLAKFLFTGRCTTKKYGQLNSPHLGDTFSKQRIVVLPTLSYPPTSDEAEPGRDTAPRYSEVSKARALTTSKLGRGMVISCEDIML